MSRRRRATRIKQEPWFQEVLIQLTEQRSCILARSVENGADSSTRSQVRSTWCRRPIVSRACGWIRVIGVGFRVGGERPLR